MFRDCLRILFCAVPLSLHPVNIPSLEEMTLEEKVGQLLIAHFYGETVNEDARILIEGACVGGIIYYDWANGLHNPKQVQKLSNELQKMVQENRYPVALFLSIDQEGGLVSQLKSGFTVFPGNWALGRTKDPHLAELSSYAIGKEMFAVGLNVDFAPVVDVNCNPRNPAIGIRSFSDSVEVVAAHAKSALRGYHQANVISTLKHFPGHGDVTFDSHEYLPVVNKSKEELMRVDLYPYQQLILSAEMVMAAHVSVPSLDPNHCATFSNRILEDLLRHEMGFKGIVISDSLLMEGLFAICSSIEEAALRAFNAGCDILLLGGKQLIGQRVNFELTVKDVKRIHRFLVESVKSGEIAIERVDASVKRILDLKAAYGLFDQAFPEEMEIAKYVNTEENRRLAAYIASLSVEMVQNGAEPIAWDSLKVAVVVPSTVKELVKKSTLMALSREMFLVRYACQQPTDEEILKCHAIASQAEAVIICSYNAWQFPEQYELIQSLIASSRKAVVLALKDPQDKSLFPEAHTVITTCSPTIFSLEAAVQKLKSN